MTLIVCIDDEGGMTFNNRRQSRDRIVTEDIIRTAGGRLLAAPFSAKLLSEYSDVKICDEPLAVGKAGDCCFIELGSVRPYSERLNTIIIYRWNRLYPSDTSLDIEPLELGFRLEETREFVGSSHEKITREVYRR